MNNNQKISWTNFVRSRAQKQESILIHIFSCAPLSLLDAVVR